MTVEERRAQPAPGPTAPRHLDPRHASARRVRRRRRLLRTVLVLALVVGLWFGLAKMDLFGTSAPSANRPLAAGHGVSGSSTSDDNRTPPPRRTTVPPAKRVTGADRYATAVALSRSAYPTGTHPTSVFVVGGTDWTSAAAAGSAAAADGVVLATASAALPASVADEIKRLHPDRVVVVGSTKQVSSAVSDGIHTIVKDVERVSGDGPTATSVAVAKDRFADGGARTAYVASSRTYAEGLAAAAAAGTHNGPLVLLDGRAGGLPADVRALLADLKVKAVTVVGSTGVVSKGIEDGLRAAGPTVTRVAGSDGDDTTVRLAAAAFSKVDQGTAYLASATDQGSGLGVAAVAGHARRPVIMTPSYCVTSAARTQLMSGTSTSLTLLGGTHTLRGLVPRLEPCKSLDDPTSVWVVVNKQRHLKPIDYAPPLSTPKVPRIPGHQLRPEVARAVEHLFAAGRAAGAGAMSLNSGYRSYATQKVVFNGRAAALGATEAAKWVAKPGFSEHQTGLALDIGTSGTSGCGSHTCLGRTEQGRWLAANAWRWGFVLRYEPGHTSTTGYDPEPWHFRYVGTTLAADYHAAGWHTLEEYFGLPAAPRY